MKKWIFRSRSKNNKTHLHIEPGQKDFIFESQSSKRWNLLIIFFALLAILFCLVIFFSGLGLYANPQLPKLETKETDEFLHISPSETMTSPQVASANIDMKEKFLQQ